MSKAILNPRCLWNFPLAFRYVLIDIVDVGHSFPASLRVWGRGVEVISSSSSSLRSMGQ